MCWSLLHQLWSVVNSISTTWEITETGNLKSAIFFLTKSPGDSDAVQLEEQWLE